MKRPTLSPALSADEFLRWYWLKSELLAACRVLGIRTSGSKPELTARIAAALAGEAIAPTRDRLRRGTMPTRFTLRTRIGVGWRCTPALGAFLRTHAGRGFRFNAAVRTFVHTQVGAPVSAILECYRASVAPGAPRAELPQQLEYNRHMQAFAREQPGASREEMLAAWKARKERRRDA
jgi:hypothetical protein